MGTKQVIEIGKRYTRLIILTDSGQRRYKNIVWRCICDCGQETLADTNSLNMGNKRSCGCLSIKLSPGEAGLRELYRAYRHDAKHRNRVFHLSIEEFKAIVTGPCTYCG